MPPAWFDSLKKGFLKFWRTDDSRIAGLRDVVVAALVVFLVLGIIWGYTGQKFPTQAPLVVVESGSMMHGKCQLGIRENCARPNFGTPPFGRFGTIDPGDLVFVKKVRSLDEVEDAFGAGGRDGYGSHGDVLVYKPGGSSKTTPIIHRAALLIKVDREGCTPNAAQNPCRYLVPATCDSGFADFTGDSGWEKYCQGSPDPITLSLNRDGIRLQLVNWPCPSTATCGPIRSGFLTKGDNNPNMDQPGGSGQFSGNIAPGPVELSWIVGKARGEIPWFGLIKLAIFGNANYRCRSGEGCSDPTLSQQWTILRATAPWDIWIALFLAIGALIGITVGVDYGFNRWRAAREAKKPPSG